MRENLQGEIEKLRLAVEELSEQYTAKVSGPEDLGLAVEELHTGLEQLLAVTEEMQQQTEALFASRQALEAERRRYQNLFELAPDAYLITDSTAVIREANRGAEKLLGISPSRLVGKPLVVFTGKEDRRALRTWLARLESEGSDRLQDFEVTLRPRAGPPVAVSVTVGITRGPDGTVTGLRWLLRDQTERKRAEERLRLLAGAGKILGSSLDYEATLQGLAHLVVPALADWCTVNVVDGKAPDLTIVVHTDPPKEQMLQGLFRRYPFNLNMATLPARALHAGQPEMQSRVSDADLEATAPDEEYLSVVRAIGIRSVIAVPLVARGRTLGVLTLVLSESGREYGPTDLSLADLLGRRAALAIDNARLYHEAQEAIQARDEFLSAAAHELKTPITNLRGYAQLEIRRLLREDTADPQRIRRTLQVIDSQSLRLALLIGQLLDLTLIDSAQFVLNRQTVDVAGLVRSVVANEQMGTRHHTLVVQAPDTASARVDGPRLEQVLASLIDNAVKFSPAGAPIEVELALPEAGTLCLSVRDHGPGISPENRHRLFSRFFQAQTGRPFGGLGLGLYVSRYIVEAHGGHIKAEFPPDGGTRFVVTIPV